MWVINLEVPGMNVLKGIEGCLERHRGMAASETAQKGPSIDTLSPELPDFTLVLKPLIMVSIP